MQQDHPSDPPLTDGFQPPAEPIPVIHREAYGAGFEEWLKHQLAGFRRESPRTVGLDVGAFKGEFMTPLVADGLIDEAVLFEANPHNAKALKEAFPERSITIEEQAVGARPGELRFHFGDDPATGSLLQPIGPTPPANQARTIPVVTLDDYAREHDLLQRVNLLKTDTQGCDLDVLKGAAEVLAASRPIVITEMLFADLYDNQCSAYEVIDWLRRHDYQLVGFFDEHFGREGWLSWCDGCFLPAARMTAHHAPFQIRQSPPPAPAPPRQKSGKPKRQPIGRKIKAMNPFRR